MNPGIEFGEMEKAVLTIHEMQGAASPAFSLDLRPVPL